MKHDNQNMPVFVTGIDRSGSIFITDIFKACGLFIGETNDQLENKKIKSIVDDYYEMINTPTRGHFLFPDVERMLIPSNWKSSVSECIKNSNYIDEVWGYHSPRIVQLWPVWNYAFPNAKWVIVRRRSADIVKSCMQTDYMDTFKNEENQKVVGVKSEQDGWLWHIHENEKLFSQMINEGVNCKVIWPERLSNGDYSQLFDLVDWIGLKWNNSVFNLIKSTINKE